MGMDNRHTVHIWDWAKGELLQTGQGKNGVPPSVYGVRFNPFLGLTADMDVDGDFADPAESAAKAAPKTAAKIEGIADKDQPLSKEDREQCLGLVKELTPDNLARFCTDFRRDFNLASDAKVAPALTSVKHQNWMNPHLKNYV